MRFSLVPRTVRVLVIVIAMLALAPTSAFAARNLQVIGALLAPTATRVVAGGTVTYTAEVDNAYVSFNDLLTDLGTHDVVLETAMSGAQDGTITFNTDLNLGGVLNNLTLNAQHDVSINYDIDLDTLFTINTPQRIVVDTDRVRTGEQHWNAPVELTNNVSAIGSTGDITFTDTVDIDAPLVVEVASGHQADFDAAVTSVGGLGNITKRGSGKLEFKGNNTYTSGTTVEDGTLVVTGDTTSDITVDGQLRGEGTTAGVVSISSIGTLRPGTDTDGPLTQFGILGAAGFTMTAGSTYAVAIDAVTGHSRISAPAITLGAATLSLTLGVNRPAINASTTIVNNMHGSLPIVGTFAGLSQGDEFSVGTTTFQISYVGDTGNDVTLRRVVYRPTTVTSPIGATTVGANASFATTVTGDTPTGNVRYYVDGNDMGTVALTGGVATFDTSSLTVGSHTIVADYGGDANNASRTGDPIVHTVVAHATTTSLARSALTTKVGDPLTLKATITSAGGTPTGTVTFRDGATTLDTVTLNGGGIAEMITSALSVGTHSISATYNADATRAGSSNTVSHVVTAAPAAIIATSTALTQSRATTVVGGEFEVKAVVTAASGTPAGTITFLDGARTLGTATVGGGGITKLSTRLTTAGTHVLTARFTATSSHAESTSSALNHMVIAPFLTRLRITPGCLVAPNAPMLTSLRTSIRTSVTYTVLRQTRPAAAVPRRCPRANRTTGAITNTGTRFATVATKTVSLRPGVRTRSLASILGRRTLTPGHYVLVISGTRIDGTPAADTRLGFVVLRRR